MKSMQKSMQKSFKKEMESITKNFEAQLRLAASMPPSPGLLPRTDPLLDGQQGQPAPLIGRGIPDSHAACHPTIQRLQAARGVR